MKFKSHNKEKNYNNNNVKNKKNQLLKYQSRTNLVHPVQKLK